MTRPFEEHRDGCEFHEIHRWDQKEHHVCRYYMDEVKDCKLDRCPMWPEEAE